MPDRKLKKKRAKKTLKKALPETPKDLSGQVLAMGGQYVSVQWLDERPDEEVLVHLVKIEAYPLWLFLLQGGKDYSFVELSCDRKTDWAADMHPLSVQRLKKLAVELNFTAAQEWATTQADLMEDQIEVNERYPKLTALQVKAQEESSSGSTDTP